MQLGHQTLLAVWQVRYSLCLSLPAVIRRLLLPLSYMTFGERLDRELLTLNAAAHRPAGEDSSHSAFLMHHCLHALQQRVKLSWEWADSVRGSMRQGQLMPALSLTLTQFAQLLAPPVVFFCECDNKQSEMTDSQHLDASRTTPAPPAFYRSSSIALPALSSPSSFSSASTSQLILPPSLIRNVSNVLMADKLVRSLSKPSSPLAHPKLLSSEFPHGDSLPVLVGFGPHRVPVGSFVRVAVHARNNSGVLGALTLQLHIVREDGADSGQQQQHQQSAVLTAGSLSPVLPPIAAGSSVRHEWAVCCLAKGQFAFRISAQTHTAQPRRTVVAAQESAAPFARLHASLDNLQREEGLHTAVSQQTLFVRAQSVAKQETDHSAATHFTCPQLLLFDAYV